MKCSFISDLHIKKSGDNSEKLLQLFCENPHVRTSDSIYFLGDIFDFLLGEHKQYISKYKLFFTQVVDMLNSGKKVIFIEGNHDFHFKRVFTDFVKESSSSSHNFRYIEKGEILTLAENKYFICHGYEIDCFNEAFNKWYAVYTSRIFQMLVTYIIPYFLVLKIGDWASNNSKKRGKKKFDLETMKAKYRLGAQALIKEKKVKGVVAGHTHVPEFYTFHDNTLYLNSGFPLEDKCFVHFNGERFDRIYLEADQK